MAAVPACLPRSCGMWPVRERSSAGVAWENSISSGRIRLKTGRTDWTLRIRLISCATIPHHESYPVPYQSRRERRRSRPRKSDTAATFSLFVAGFVLSFIPAGSGNSGPTLLIWGIGFAMLIFKVFK